VEVSCRLSRLLGLRGWLAGLDRQSEQVRQGGLSSGRLPVQARRWCALRAAVQLRASDDAVGLQLARGARNHRGEQYAQLSQFIFFRSHLDAYPSIKDDVILVDFVHAERLYYYFGYDTS